MTHAALLMLVTVTSGLDAHTRLEELTLDQDANVVYDGQQYTPDEFVAAIATVQAQNSQGATLFRFLNISSWSGLIWVSLGLGGQVLFTIRLTIQWLASEKHRKSIIPVAYWWCSIIGASMLIAYFIWRWDVIALLGQCFGWLIYVRNLYFMYAEPKHAEVLA